MVSKFTEMVNEKIEEESLLTIGINCGSSHIMEAIVPYTINTDSGIYIEGENFSLNITDDEEYVISYDEIEEDFIITQGNNVFYLG